MKPSNADRKEVFFIVWIFLLFNYLYCDVLSLMDSSVLNEVISGKIGNLTITSGFLLGSAILMEIPIAMILLSRFLKYKANRLANIIAGSVMAIIQVLSLFVGTPALYYIFYSIIEIAANLFIVWYAISWKKL